MQRTLTEACVLPNVLSEWLIALSVALKTFFDPTAPLMTLMAQLVGLFCLQSESMLLPTMFRTFWTRGGLQETREVQLAPLKHLKWLLFFFLLTFTAKVTFQRSSAVSLNSRPFFHLSQNFAPKPVLSAERNFNHGVKCFLYCSIF